MSALSVGTLEKVCFSVLGVLFLLGSCQSIASQADGGQTVLGRPWQGLCMLLLNLLSIEWLKNIASVAVQPQGVSTVFVFVMLFLCPPCL